MNISWNWQTVFFLLAFGVILLGLIWNSWLYAKSMKFRYDGPDGGEADDYLWVFVVPALNEEITIADSVERLLKSQCSHRRVLVIDDGSTDGTADILNGIDHPDLLVLHREPPNSRLGKAATLNEAWRMLRELGASGEIAGFSAEKTIMVVVDADGRLAPEAPGYVASWFDDSGVGGVQVRVRIYNRDNLLTWEQDVEFGVFGLLYQAARAKLGTAGMGGNGQFNRLSALDDIAERSGSDPWNDKLTEDQDLGLQLLEAGWTCGQENRTAVDQQGLSSLRKLMRQRTRWAQGNMQAVGHIKKVHSTPLSLSARLDLYMYLLQPAIQGFVGLAFLGAIGFTVFGDVPIVPGNILFLAAFYLLGFGGVILGCIARSGRGPINWIRGFLIANVHAFYSWLLWPVLLRAFIRQLTARDGWAKTQREQLKEPETPATDDRPARIAA